MHPIETVACDCDDCRGLERSERAVLVRHVVHSDTCVCPRCMEGYIALGWQHDRSKPRWDGCPCATCAVAVAA